MPSGTKAFELKPFPPIRRATIDLLEVSRRKHMIHALVEVDVTKPRRLIAEWKARTGEALSFTGFLIHCLAQAVGENKYMHAYRDWRNRLVLFDEVDVSTAIEREHGGRKEVFPMIKRRPTGRLSRRSTGKSEVHRQRR